MIFTSSFNYKTKLNKSEENVSRIVYKKTKHYNNLGNALTLGPNGIGENNKREKQEANTHKFWSVKCIDNMKSLIQPDRKQNHYVD